MNTKKIKLVKGIPINVDIDVNYYVCDVDYRIVKRCDFWSDAEAYIDRYDKQGKWHIAVIDTAEFLNK